MRTWRLCCLITLLAVRASASDENIATVVQPLGTSSGSHFIASVTYIGYTVAFPVGAMATSRESRATEILRTVEPNVVWCDGKPQDRNSAVVAGIKFELTRKARADTSDTLHVVVNLSAFAQGERRPDEIDHRLLTSTLWCGLRNARLRWPEVRFVQYEVQGQETLAHYSGVYPLERVAPPEKPKQWLRAGPGELVKQTDR